MADLPHPTNTQSTQEAVALPVPVASLPDSVSSNASVRGTTIVAVATGISTTCTVPAQVGNENENSIVTDPAAIVAKMQEENTSLPACALESEITTTSVIPPVTTSSPPKTKSKKKKSSSHGASASQSGDGENTGRWTAEEHRLFLQGLEQHGKGWKKIASLIKSRTVVQIRTHAQKYFQKLSKARQNGEEGDVTMEGRGCAASVTSTASNIVVPTQKRRRPIAGTKRRTIQSVVASAQRQRKKLLSHDTNNGWMGPASSLPSVAPALAHFLIPHVSESSDNDDIITGQGLEDALFRFLTPMPTSEPNQSKLIEIAKHAGANPILLPCDNPISSEAVEGGDSSPTGVADIFPSPFWIDAKGPPSWFAKGDDVDVLLDQAESLDWLADTGDLYETFQTIIKEECVPMATSDDEEIALDIVNTVARNSSSMTSLPRVDSNVDSIVPSLPDLFDGVHESTSSFQHLTKSDISSSNLLVPSESVASMGAHLQAFDSAIEDHDFVSTILENSRDDGDALSSII